jgi:hypothetical protein
MQIDFVKGHCGWDALTLLPEGQVPPGRELEAALKILAEPVNGGLEVGFLGRGEQPGEIQLRMVDSTSRTWIPMCGGMSQVIGKALVETFFRDQFGVDTSRAHQEFRLHTASGIVPVRVAIAGGRAVRITTVMDEFAAFQYAGGVESVTLNGCSLMRVRDYCVLDIAELERAYPGPDFTRREPGPHLEIVNRILSVFAERYEAEGGVSGMLYDTRPEGPGAFRVYPRFYSADMAAAKLSYEFQCGTGTVAVGIALAYRDLLPRDEAQGSIIFEWGSQRSTPDPYGIRTSKFDFATHAGRLIRASFSHSVVEILAEGRLTLPAYGLSATTS